MTPKRRILLLTLFLCVFGILMVFESSTVESLDTFGNKYTLTIQQLKWLAVAVTALTFCAHLPTSFWQKIAPVVYTLGILGLLSIFIPSVGITVNGAHRWISLGGFRFQPVEIMKLGIILYFSKWMSRHQRLMPFAALTLLPVTLIMLQPDLGSTLIVLTIAFGMYFAAQAPMKPILITAVVGLVGVFLLTVSSTYRLQRLQTLLHPEADPLGEGYHVHQITLALGNGGLFGTGLGQSKQKYRYIPELSTDSIFAIVAEETGFVGAFVIIMLFLLLIQSGFKASEKLEPHSFEHLATTGITIWITSQVILNLGAVVALIPLTGIPLPLISRGGTALVTIMTGIGILLSLSHTNPAIKSKFFPKTHKRTAGVLKPRNNLTRPLFDRKKP